MTRSSTPYAERREYRAFEGYDVQEPTAGHYKTRLRTGAHVVGVKIWHGAPLDPVTGEELDRGHRWQALANGAPIEVDRVWPECGRQPITEAEYQYFTGLQAWARQNAPSSPQADPTRKIDLLTAPLPL